MPKKTQKQVWEELLTLLESGVKENIEMAFASAEEQKFDIMKKLKPWEKLLGDLEVDTLVSFFSIKSLTLSWLSKSDRAILKNIKLYTQLEELRITAGRASYCTGAMALENLRCITWHVKINKGLLQCRNLRVFETPYISGFPPIDKSMMPYLERVKICGAKLTSLEELEALVKLHEVLELDAICLNHSHLVLPDDIGNVTTLSALEFFGNNIEALPESIGNLHKLEYARFESNNIRTLPDSIGKLRALKTLNLVTNKLRELPPSIGNLTNLSSLLLKQNCITELPPSIGNLKSLQKLDISENELIALPEEIGNIENLVELNLSINRRMVESKEANGKEPQWEPTLNALPKSFEKLGTLEVLNLSHTGLKGALDIVCNLRSLKKLSFAYNSVTSLPPSIENLSSLERLNLVGNYLRSLPKEITHLAKITHLSLFSNKLNKAGLAYLPPNLTTLDVDHNKIEALPKSMGTLHSLKKLSIQSNQLTELPLFLKDLPNLLAVDFKNNRIETFPFELGEMEGTSHWHNKERVIMKRG